MKLQSILLILAIYTSNSFGAVLKEGVLHEFPFDSVIRTAEQTDNGDYSTLSNILFYLDEMFFDNYNGLSDELLKNINLSGFNSESFKPIIERLNNSFPGFIKDESDLINASVVLTTVFNGYNSQALLNALNASIDNVIKENKNIALEWNNYTTLYYALEEVDRFLKIIYEIGKNATNKLDSVFNIDFVKSLTNLLNQKFPELIKNESDLLSSSIFLTRSKYFDQEYTHLAPLSNNTSDNNDEIAPNFFDYIYEPDSSEIRYYIPQNKYFNIYTNIFNLFLYKNVLDDINIQNTMTDFAEKKLFKFPKYLFLGHILKNNKFTSINKLERVELDKNDQKKILAMIQSLIENLKTSQLNDLIEKVLTKSFIPSTNINLFTSFFKDDSQFTVAHEYLLFNTNINEKTLNKLLNEWNFHLASLDNMIYIINNEAKYFIDKDIFLLYWRNLSQILNNSSKNINNYSQSLTHRSPLTIESMNPDNQIIRYIAEDDYDKLYSIIKRDNPDLNFAVNFQASRPYSGYTPLLTASGQNDANIIRLLIDSGADINIKNSNGRCALVINIMSSAYNINNVSYFWLTPYANYLLVYYTDNIEDLKSASTLIDLLINKHKTDNFIYLTELAALKEIITEKINRLSPQ